MPLLIRSELRHLLRNPLNTLFVTLSLSIGVASVALTHQLSLEIITRLSNTGLAETYDGIIYLDSRTEREYFEFRRRWRRGELPTVSHLVPVIEGSLVLEGQSVSVLGYDPIAAGVLPSTTTFQDSEVSEFLLTDTVMASGLVIEPGSRVFGAKVLSVSRASSPRLLGDIPTVQTLLARPGELDAVWLRKPKSTNEWLDRLVPGLLAASSGGSATHQLAGYEIVPFDWWNPSQSLGDAIVFNLGMLSFLTLLVAGFIVFQALQSNIKNRSTQFALMESIGVSRFSERSLVLFQSSLFGLIGSVLGLFFAWLVMVWLRQLGLVEEGTYLDEIGVYKALVLGLLTTLFVGCSISTRKRKHMPFLSGAAILAAVGGMGWGLTASSGLLGASLLNVAFCVIHVCLIVPIALISLERLFLSIKTRSLFFRINVRNAIASATTLRLATNALSIAIATSIGLGLMLSSFRAEFEQLLEQRLLVGLHLSNAAEVDPALLASRDDVQSIRAYSRGTSLVNGVPMQLTATVLDRAEATRYGYGESLTDGVLVNEVATLRHGLKVGDPVVVDGAVPGRQELSVRHVFKDYGAPQPRIIVPMQLVDRKQLTTDRYSLETSEPSGIRTFLAQTYANVQIVDHVELRTAAIQAFDASFAIARFMVNIAIVVAVIGMACALIGMQAKQLLEMRLLTTMGTSRLALVRNAMLQNALLGTFAVVLAIPLSLAIAWNLCYLVNPRAYGWSFDLAFSWSAVLVPAGLGIAAAIAAGFEPLRRLISKVSSEPIFSTR